MAIFAVIAVIGVCFTGVHYIALPEMLFGIGRYNVVLELPEAAGLYPRANVTYRGTEVGQVQSVKLTDTGVQAHLSLQSKMHIPSNLQAEVHSQTAVGENFVALLPRDTTSAPLHDGSVIAASNVSVPEDINTLLDDTNRGLQAIPGDNLRTVIDETYTAVAGLGPELSRIVRASSELAAAAYADLDALKTLIDRTPPVLNSQTHSADAIGAWSAHAAAITNQLRDRDQSLRSILHDGPEAADQARQLFERLQPTLPVLLANLVSINDVAITYQPNLEQLLVLLPQGTQIMQALLTANRNTKQTYTGAYINFNLNLNLPPVCNTGFLPPQQIRVQSYEDYPDRPPGDLYCRIPQDAPFNVRGVRNTPCETKPGKRAPTVQMCESEADYIPLNDGTAWKGDPNATSTGQSVPQPRTPLPPAAAVPFDTPSPPPIAAAEYDPITGEYIGPDGKHYRQGDLARPQEQEKTWQTLLVPPTS